MHKTYWLNGSLANNWNRSQSSFGPAVSAGDGDTLTIMLLSTDSISHSWYLDFIDNLVVDSNEVNTRSPDFRSTSTWTNFTIITALGTIIPHGGVFTYRCAQHARFMYGTFKFYAGPVASFNHTPTTPLVGHPVTFNASSSFPTFNASAGYSKVKDPGSATLTQGRNTTATVTLSLTSGTPENVTLSYAATPPNPTITLSFNTTSGFPTYSASLKITTFGSSQTGTFTVTVRAVSNTGVAHNTTFTLTLNPSSPTVLPPPPNYFLPALIGTVAALSVLIALVALTKLRKRKPLG